MGEISQLVDGLFSKDNKYAYDCLKKLKLESENSNKVYFYFDKFVELLNDSNSYKRNRAFELISSNAKWDIDYKIDEIIDEYLKHILDEKPISFRQCIKSLSVIGMYKKDLVDDIIYCLKSANISIYKESMGNLIQKDIKNTLNILENLEK